MGRISDRADKLAKRLRPPKAAPDERPAFVKMAYHNQEFNSSTDKLRALRAKRLNEAKDA